MMATTVSASKSLQMVGMVGGGRAIIFSSLLRPWDPSSLSCSDVAAISSISETVSTTSLHPQGTEEEKVRGWSKWLLFIPGALTFGLGTWQIFRRQEKINMLEYRQKRLALEPIKFNDTSPSIGDMASLEFRRVACKGVFDEKKTIYVGPRSRSISGVTENGYYVIVPLMPVPDNPDSVQSPLLVNRGWVPRSWKDKFFEVSQHGKQPSDQLPPFEQERKHFSWWNFWSKKSNTIRDPVPCLKCQEVVGVIRGSEKPSIFVPGNDPSSNQWFYVDVPAIACACGLPENTVYVEDTNENVSPSNPYPVPKDVNTLIRSSVMPQDHLNYTLTWYSLSAAVTFMAFKRLRPRKSRR